MKKLFIITLCILLSSCSPKIIRMATSEDKADFGITNPTKALFFVENENIPASDERINHHKETADKIYGQFGGATERVMVGRTNAKTFKFSNGETTWFVDVQKFPKRTAMILFDGKNEPIIEYNTKKYGKRVEGYLSDDLKKLQQLYKENRTERKETQSIMDSIWSIPFLPDQKYADKIINHANTVYYPLTTFEDSGKCDGRFRNLIYKDEKEKEISYTATNTYRNGRILEYQYSREGLESVQKYYFSKVGLLDSIVNSQNGKREMKLNFKYLPNKFIIYDVNYGTREEFHLNAKGQVDVKYDFDKKNKISREILYTHDYLGRLIKERYIADGEEPHANTYQYDSDKRGIYSKMSIEGKNGKVMSENRTQILDGKQIFTTIADGKIQYKSISTLDGNCEGKVITSDANGKVVSVSVQRKL